MSIGKNTRKPVAAASPMPRTIDSATSDMDHTKRLFVLKFNSLRGLPNRQLSECNVPPLMIRAFGAHCHFRTHAVQQTDYSMTSSASASTVGGTDRPSVLAVLRLITSWY